MACVFCASEGPMSKEDAIPRWALRKIGTLGKIVTRLAPSDEYLRTYTGIVARFPDVCARCNNGWLSRLEATVRPWLEPTLVGEGSAFATPQQQTLAFWAAKTATLYEAAMRMRTHGPSFPPETWAWLYARRDSREPPPGTHVWFSRYDPWNPPNEPDTFRVSNTLPTLIRYAHRPGDADPASLHYFHTFTIGYLAVQVFGQRFRSDGRSHDDTPLADMLPPARVEPLQVRVWPKPERVVVWPPKVTIANAEIAEFARWVSELDYYLVGIGSAERVRLAESESRARFGSLSSDGRE